ncbi:MAG: bifunctional pyr operon transcriptional regulator/uracil phosphoribosyltransferase PyrR [Phycisphaerales bacterium]
MRVLAEGDRFQQLIDSLCGDIGAAIDAEPLPPKSTTLDSPSGWALVGVRSRGDVIAKRVAESMGEGRFAGRVGTLDITLYRDDLSEIGPQPVVRTTEIDFPIDGLNIVLIDDVLMTGRSVRAALQSLMDLGRPKRVWLAVLVDRGGRELPIAPDFVALNLTVGEADAPAHGAKVQVMVTPTDERDAVIVYNEQEQERAERG